MLTEQQKRSIQKDISPWKKNICSIKLMKKVARSHHRRMCLFQIHQNNLIPVVGNPNFWQYVKTVLSIKRILAQNRIKDTWILFNGYDEPLGSPENKEYHPELLNIHGYPEPLIKKFLCTVPIFSVSKIEDFHHDILFPFANMYDEPVEILSPAWEEKHPVLFWRGASSGHRLYENMINHRIRFVNYCWNKKNMDVGFSTIRMDKRIGPHRIRLKRYQKKKSKIL